MGSKAIRSNFRVVIPFGIPAFELRDASRVEAVIRREGSFIADQVRRHVDCDARFVTTDFDVSFVCEHCGRDYDASPGGACCSLDEAERVARAKEAQG